MSYRLQVQVTMWEDDEPVSSIARSWDADGYGWGDAALEATGGMIRNAVSLAEADTLRAFGHRAGEIVPAQGIGQCEQCGQSSRDLLESRVADVGLLICNRCRGGRPGPIERRLCDGEVSRD